MNCMFMLSLKLLAQLGCQISLSSMTSNASPFTRGFTLQSHKVCSAFVPVISSPHISKYIGCTIGCQELQSGMSEVSRIAQPLTTMSSATPPKRKLGSPRYRKWPAPLEALATAMPVSPPAAPPAKRSKPAPPSPPAPGPPPPPSVCEMEEDGPSVFDVLHVFRRRWFLNRDH